MIILIMCSPAIAIVGRVITWIKSKEKKKETLPIINWSRKSFE